MTSAPGHRAAPILSRRAPLSEHSREHQFKRVRWIGRFPICFLSGQCFGRNKCYSCERRAWSSCIMGTANALPSASGESRPGAPTEMKDESAIGSKTLRSRENGVLGNKHQRLHAISLECDPALTSFSRMDRTKTRAAAASRELKRKLGDQAVVTDEARLVELGGDKWFARRQPDFAVFPRSSGGDSGGDESCLGEKPSDNNARLRIRLRGRMRPGDRRDRSGHAANEPY